MPFKPSSLLALLLLVAFAASTLSPAEARTRRRRAPRTPPRPSGSLVVTVFDPADPASVGAGYRTVRLLDAYDGKWERRVDSTGVVTFAGVPPGRAIVSWWTPPGDSLVAASDTVMIVVGRTAEAMLRLVRGVPAAPRPAPTGDVTVIVTSRGDRDSADAVPLSRAFVRIVDSAGARHESFAAADGWVKFTGVAPGRAIRTAWTHGALPDRDEPAGSDTIQVFPGARVDTMRVVRHSVAGEGGTR